MVTVIPKAQSFLETMADELSDKPNFHGANHFGSYRILLMNIGRLQKKVEYCGVLGMYLPPGKYLHGY